MAEKETQLVKRWSDRIATSGKWLDQVSEDNHWEKMIEQVKGKYDVVLGNLYVPPINEVYAYIEAAKANLFAANPYIAVNAKKTGTILGAYIWEMVLNYYWSDLKIKDDVELEISDALVVGHAWHKTGKNVKTSGSGDQLRLQEDALFSNRVSWRDIRINVGCQRPPADCLWIAHGLYRPTEDVKDDYGRAASKLSGSPHPSVAEKYRKNTIYKEDINFSRLWEIWDARERKIYLMADETTNAFLEDPRPWPDWANDFEDVFQRLSFNPQPDEPYPMSDIAPWNPQVLEKIKIFTQMLNHMKRWNRQIIAKKNVITGNELDKFEKGIDGTILSASTGMDIQQAFKTLDFGPLPNDVYLILDRLDQVKREVSGQPEFERGANTKTGTRTLGELKLIQGGSGARTDRKLNRIEMHCEAIARALKANLSEHFSVEQTVKITGKEPKEVIAAFIESGMFDPRSQTITFQPEDIKGDYDVGIKAGSTLPLDKMTRDQILDNVLEMSVQMMQAPMIPPFVAELIKERLRDYGIKSLEAAFDAQMQAEAQKEAAAQGVQQKEEGKIVSETEKRQAQAAQIHVDTLIKGAQAAGKGLGLIPPEVSLTK